LGSELPLKCPVGTFNNEENQIALTDCLTCLPGKYCSAESLVLPQGDCDPGYYCWEGSISKTPLVHENPTNIPISKFGPCPAGHYCPQGTVEPFECPAGTFNPLTGQDAVGDCQACTAGFYCSSSGLTAVEGSCAPGYYCPVGSKEIKPIGKYCAAGQYCPLGSAVATSCPAGTYQP